MRSSNGSQETIHTKPLSRKQKVYYAFYENKIGTKISNNYPVIRIAGKYLRSFGFEIGTELRIDLSHEKIVVSKVSPQLFLNFILQTCQIVSDTKSKLIMENSNQSNGKPNLYQAETNQILDLLENQKLTWDKPWVSIAGDGKRAHNAVSDRTYSGVNQILLSMRQLKTGYPYSGWLTYKQVQDAGGQVLAGMKSSSVFFNKVVYYDKDGKKHETVQVQEMSEAEQTQLDLKKHSVLLYYNVFNVAQTSGLPHSYYELKDQPKLTNVEKDDKAENLIIQTNARIIHVVGDEACYNYVNDVIFLPERNQFKGTVEYYEIALHELAHWTGHKSRLYRSLKNVFGSEDYAKEELVAELYSAFICADLGFSMVITNNAAYIQNWIRV